MKLAPYLVLPLFIAMIGPSFALAAPTVVRGTITMTQGHESPACRTVVLRRDSDNSVMLFRIPSAVQDNGILAVTITALVQRLKVDIIYDPALTTGCGAEPRIQYIDIIAAD